MPLPISSFIHIRTIQTRILPVLLFLLLSGHFVFAQDAARNRKPKIVGQRTLTITEGESITLELGDLDVDDRDDWFYPWGFTMAVLEGDMYSVSGTTVTPHEDFDGTLTVWVVVNDGDDDSDEFPLQIQVSGINDPPVIRGQQTISTREEESVTLQLSLLDVYDPDNVDLSMAIATADNCTIENNRITPNKDFNGTLLIPVTVADGEYISEIYQVEVTVTPVNDKPVVVSQQELSTSSTTPISISLDDFSVTDPDNKFPDDFSLYILNGTNYTVSETTITPDSEFEGDLKAGVIINDGDTDSDVFNLIINVKRGNKKPVITSQSPVIINEDETFTFTYNHIKVSDVDGFYPAGYSMILSQGENYTLSGLTLRPDRDFSGNLFVPVTVSDGEDTSDYFTFQISVRPVNDAPVLTLNDQDSIIIMRGNGPTVLFKSIDIIDVDNDSIALAEVGFNNDNYVSGTDVLQFTNTQRIKGFFDSKNGILALIGKASIEEYKTALQSIKAEVTLNTNTGRPESSSVYITVNDGQTNSNRIVKTFRIVDEAVVELQIPSGFTPNGDDVNDTWSIRPMTDTQGFSGARVRIYSKSGILVFESNGLDKEWDGRLNGTLLPADVYFYTIDLNTDDAKPSLKGVVTILR